MKIQKETLTCLSCDIETYSDRDLKKCGVYKYSESPHAELLLFGYSVNNGPVQVVDVACGEIIPKDILQALTDDTVTKWAYNASFERVFLSIWLKRNYPEYFKSYGTPDDSVGNYLDPSSWRCSLVWGAYMGLPLSLEWIGAVLKLEDQKMKEGKDLIRYFCVPCKPTKTNGGRTRNLPEHAPEKWELFKSYNKRDVEVEMDIQKKLQHFPVPESVWEEYHLDQEINDRGIKVDMQFVKNAISFDAKSKESLMAVMQDITRLENPNSVVQMKQWLSENGLETESLGKKDVKNLIGDTRGAVRKALSLRLQLAKSSVKKYQAMQNAVCDDGRARGMFFFYGASRSGRWAGRIIQLQNLPQNHLSDLDEARELVRTGDFDSFDLLYDNIPDTLSQLIRTAFIPKDGYRFIVADFSAIEARVLSHLAGETWRSEVFAQGKDIYCASASQMFKVPVEKHGVNSHLRQKGKQAELACIAEGSLVLTDQGLIPIESVTTDMKVWDGLSWVNHGGVFYKGEKEVITYEGLTATPDHLVWIHGSREPVPFSIAAKSGAHLVQTGNGRSPIRLGEDHLSGETMEQILESLLCFDPVHWMRICSMAASGQPSFREIQRLSALLSAPTYSSLVGKSSDCSQTTVREPQESQLSQLWSQRNQIPFSFCNRGWPISNPEIWSSGQIHGNRQNRHQRGLCSREPAVCNSPAELCEPEEKCALTLRTAILALFLSCCDPETISGTFKGSDHPGCRDSRIREKKELADHKRKARLYDIRNAGRYHRFTVSGKLVHNCGYGGSVGALKAMGALEMGLKEEELQPLVDAWRSANPNIVKFWWDVDRCVKETVKKHITTETHNLMFSYQSGMMFIHLPSGRKLCYVKPKIGENKFGGESVTYEGVGTTKKWERIESYGPKFVENIVQGISRDILCHAIRTLSHCYICGHVHDELIIECSPEVSVDAVCEQMSKPPKWLPGICLDSAGYSCATYRKD